MIILQRLHVFQCLVVPRNAKTSILAVGDSRAGSEAVRVEILHSTLLLPPPLLPLYLEVDRAIKVADRRDEQHSD